MSAVRRLWSRVERSIGTRAGAVVVGFVAVAAHTLVSVVLPVAEGADYVTYVRVYAEMWSWDSVIPWAMLWRMPVAPALMGLPLDLGGPWAGRIVMALAFGAIVVVWLRIALRFGRRCAAVTAGVLVIAPSFQMLFHQYSSDVVAGIVFALLALALVRAWEDPSTGRFAVFGLLLAVMALTRPAHQVLFLLVPLPLLLVAARRLRLRWTAVVAVTALVPCLVWVGLNGVRYDDLALSRGGGAWTPFYRAYLTDRLVRPANGPASRELAELVQSELLPFEPYRSHGVTLAGFFGEPDTRYHEDLVGLTDRVYGWDDQNAILRRVALEGIRRDEWSFVRGVARSFAIQLVQGDSVLPRGAQGDPTDGPAQSADSAALVGTPIPAARFSYWLSRPDNAFTEVWTSPVDHVVVSDDPALLARLERMNRRVAELGLPPTHDGSLAVMRWVNRVNQIFPSPLFLVAVGFLGLALRRPVPEGVGIPALLVLASMAILAATVVSVPELPRFVSPLYPAFALFVAVCLVGHRRALTR